MIFDAELAKARDRQAALAELIRRAADARAAVVARLDRYIGYAAAFEAGLAAIRATGEPRELLVHNTNWWRSSGSVGTATIWPGSDYWIRRGREGWPRAIARLEYLRDKLDRRIRDLEERKLRLDLWLLEKEETWGKLDPATLRAQVREVLLAADELSVLVVGRKVPVAFDTRDNSPLGYVPVHKHKGAGRKVFLSAALLAEQPEHVLDYYRALIVHELGHVLMHLKDSGREYRRFRRLMRDRVTRAPHFFDVFNIILDEQLERVLRDTKPEWQRWFNRLDFYARRIPLTEAKAFVAKSGAADPEAAFAGLVERRVIKVYPDPRKPFVTIQSAELFSEGLGFSRLYAFFAVLRHRLPHATVREPWLRECLELIPKDFKTLDVFDVHALAVRVYKILVGDVPGAGFVTVKVRRAGGDAEVELPGAWVPGGRPEKGKVIGLRAKRKKGGGTSSGGTSPPAPPGRWRQPDPEGEPVPPPSPPPPPSKPTPKKKSNHHVRRPSGGGGGSWPVPARAVADLPGWARPEADGKGSGRGKGGKKGGKKGTAKPSAKDQLRSRERSGKLSAKERARLQKVAREDERREAEARRAPEPLPPPPPKPPAARNDEKDDRALEAAEQLASTPLPTHAPPDTSRSKVLDQLVQEVRDEIDGVRRKPETIDRMSSYTSVAADRRNESEYGEFPPLDNLFTLRPNRATNAALARSVRPLVSVLRPYLSVADPARVLEERLAGGRRLLGAMLTKHLAYGETRLFADNRDVESDRHAELFVGVLIDTSASMKTDGRSDRAKRFAALLAECLRDCPDVASVFLGFNENLYRCGDHEAHSLGSLEPAGKTNEAAALDHLGAQFLDVPRRRKAVVVISDGLPTACSVESVRRVVRRLERERGARCLHVALSAENHPAYRRRADLGGELRPACVRAIGRALGAVLR